MSPGFWRELDAVLHHLQHSPEAQTARALVISSTGKHFSAGMALETFANPGFPDDRTPEGRAALAEMLWDMQATLTRIEELRLPVIAVLQAASLAARWTWWPVPASATPHTMPSSAYRKSTSAWWPTSAACSACPSCCPWGLSGAGLHRSPLARSPGPATGLCQCRARHP
jgi:hypothetical protein